MIYLFHKGKYVLYNPEQHPIYSQKSGQNLMGKHVFSCCGLEDINSFCCGESEHEVEHTMAASRMLLKRRKA